MIRTFVLNIISNWCLVGLLGFGLAWMCFVHARKVIQRGWSSARVAKRATRIARPFTFWSDVYFAYLLSVAAFSVGCYCTWRLATRT